MAQAKGCQQVLWLHGDERYITEVGTMNVFMCLKNKKGGTELVTPPLNGLILPGVTRQSILDLGRTWVNRFEFISNINFFCLSFFFRKI
jgi:branched-chain amino acid aminotransferase